MLSGLGPEEGEEEDPRVALARASYSKARNRLADEDKKEGKERVKQAMGALFAGTREAVRQRNMVNMWVGSVSDKRLEEEEDQWDPRVDDGMEQDAIQRMQSLFYDMEAAESDHSGLSSAVQETMATLQHIQGTLDKIRRLSLCQLEGLEEVGAKLDAHVAESGASIRRFSGQLDITNNQIEKLKEIRRKTLEAGKLKRASLESIGSAFSNLSDDTMGHRGSMQSNLSEAAKELAARDRERKRTASIGHDPTMNMSSESFNKAPLMPAKRRCKKKTTVLKLKKEFAGQDDLDWLKEDLVTTPAFVLRTTIRAYVRTIRALGKPAPKLLEPIQHLVPVADEDEEADEDEANLDSQDASPPAIFVRASTEGARKATASFPHGIMTDGMDDLDEEGPRMGRSISLKAGSRHSLGDSPRGSPKGSPAGSPRGSLVGSPRGSLLLGINSLTRPPQIKPLDLAALSVADSVKPVNSETGAVLQEEMSQRVFEEGSSRLQTPTKNVIWPGSPLDFKPEQNRNVTSGDGSRKASKSGAGSRSGSKHAVPVENFKDSLQGLMQSRPLEATSKLERSSAQKSSAKNVHKLSEYDQKQTNTSGVSVDGTSLEVAGSKIEDHSRTRQSSGIIAPKITVSDAGAHSRLDVYEPASFNISLEEYDIGVEPPVAPAGELIGTQCSRLEEGDRYNVVVKLPGGDAENLPPLKTDLTMDDELEWAANDSPTNGDGRSFFNFQGENIDYQVPTLAYEPTPSFVKRQSHPLQFIGTPGQEKPGMSHLSEQPRTYKAEHFTLSPKQASIKPRAVPSQLAKEAEKFSMSSSEWAKRSMYMQTEKTGEKISSSQGWFANPSKNAALRPPASWLPPIADMTSSSTFNQGYQRKRHRAEASSTLTRLPGVSESAPVLPGSIEAVRQQRRMLATFVKTSNSNSLPQLVKLPRKLEKKPWESNKQRPYKAFDAASVMKVTPALQVVETLNDENWKLVPETLHRSPRSERKSPEAKVSDDASTESPKGDKKERINHSRIRTGRPLRGLPRPSEGARPLEVLKGRNVA
jgi:hypothetical protein